MTIWPAWLDGIPEVTPAAEYYLNCHVACPGQLRLAKSRYERRLYANNTYNRLTTSDVFDKIRAPGYW